MLRIKYPQEVSALSLMPKVRTGDIETHYEDHGSGAPIVLIHASILDHTSWRHQAQDLSRDRRVIVYDMRGHGLTGPSAPAQYTVDLLVEDLHQLLQTLDIQRPTLCGLSLGGMVALTYASRYPDHVAGLILSGTPSPPFLSFSERLQRALLPRAMIGVARLIGYERLKKSLMATQRKVHGDDAVGSLQADDLPPMETAEFGKVVRCFASFHHTHVDLSAITAPTLVLVGQHEPAFIHKHAERIRHGVATGTVDTIEGAGHAAPLDQPERFTEAVRGFAARVQPGKPPLP